MSELTTEEKAKIDKLVDPDKLAASAKYSWSEDFQRVVLGMMLCNRFFLMQSLGLIEPSYFVNESHELICKLCLQYFEKQSQQPSKIWLREAIGEFLRHRYPNQDTAESMRLIYLGELNTVVDYYSRGGIAELMPGLDSTEAILDKATAFAKTCAAQQAFAECMELVKKAPDKEETWIKYIEITKRVSLIGRKLDLGLDYFSTFDERYDRIDKAEVEKDVFCTAFRKIDEGLNFGGLKVGEIGAWMAGPGVGKSLLLVKSAVKNIFYRNRKVLYISTEMDQDLIASRFDSMISRVGQHELLPRREEVKIAINTQAQDFPDNKRLFIKQFPSGTADLNTCMAFHSQLVMYGFKPDLVIFDYPGDMKDMPGMDSWESRWKTLRDIRGFGVSEKHCTLIAIQPNRSSSKLTLDELLDESMQGESYYQNKVLDAFWTVSQTKEEKKAGVARVLVAKTRNGKSKYDFKICFDYEKQTLDSWEIGEEQYHARMGQVVSQAVGRTESKIDEYIVEPDARNKSWNPDKSEK